MSNRKPLRDAPRDGTIILVHDLICHDANFADTHWAFFNDDRLMLLDCEGETAHRGLWEFPDSVLKQATFSAVIEYKAAKSPDSALHRYNHIVEKA